MDKFLKVIGVVMLVLFAIVGLSFLMAFPTKWLINYIFTDGVRLSLFGVAKIGFWRALAINVLMGGLFKSVVNTK